MSSSCGEGGVVKDLFRRYGLKRGCVASADDVVSLVQGMLRRETEPSVAALSLLLGAVEAELTCNPALDSVSEDSSSWAFPSLEADRLDRLCDAFSGEVQSLRFDLSRFQSRIQEALVEHSNSSNNNTDSAALLERLRKVTWSAVDLADVPLPAAAWFPELVRHVIVQLADHVWSRLRHCAIVELAHCQSLYTLVGAEQRRLDTLGICLAVVAACQLLEVPGVRLALSEDHAWLVFGEQLDRSAEVSWTGRGLQQGRRGQAVEAVPGARASWLYLNGNPVVCETHWLTLAAMVTAINPSLASDHHHHQQQQSSSSTSSVSSASSLSGLATTSEELSRLKQRLLWLLYDGGHLRGYPLALVNLADLEELHPSGLGRPSAGALYDEAIRANLVHYNNSHVYPYLALAGHFYRSGKCRPALRYWCLAARTVSQYSYTREDAEIYKELFQVSNDLIPRLLRSAAEAAGADAHCLAALLQFYDWVCLWEQDSNTPVLHAGWADRIVQSLMRFQPVARQRLRVIEESAEPQDDRCRGAAPLVPEEARARSWGHDPFAEFHRFHHHQQSPMSPVELQSVARGCSEALLNPRYLLGLSPTPFLPAGALQQRGSEPLARSPGGGCPGDGEDAEGSVVTVPLRSRKMRAIGPLLCQARLNGAAIKLQLTAQSEVHFKRQHNSSVQPQQQHHQLPDEAAELPCSSSTGRSKRLRPRSGSEFLA